MPTIDYPPLLVVGLHAKTWTEIEALCVTGFPLSQSRSQILSGFRRIVDRLCAEGIEGDIWTDGSFLTQNIEPRDVDFVLRLDIGFIPRITPQQIATLKWLGTDDPQTRAEIKRDYMCDSYVFCDAPVGHPLNPGPDMRQYWLNQFGRDRSRNEKGIAVLSIPGGVR